MANDAEHVVLTLQRGERGELRLSRSRFKGAVFTKFQFWFPDDDNGLKPGKCITLRDPDLPQVIGALERIARKVGRYPDRKPDAAANENTPNQSLTPEQLDKIF